MRRLALVALAFLAGCAEPDPGTTAPKATTIDYSRTRAGLPTTLAVRTFPSPVTEASDPAGTGAWRVEGVAVSRAREACRSTAQSDLATVLSVSEPRPLLDAAGARVGTELTMSVRQGRATGVAECRYLDATGAATLSLS